MPAARKKRASVAPRRRTGSAGSPRTAALAARVARTIAASGGVNCGSKLAITSISGRGTPAAAKRCSRVARIPAAVRPGGRRTSSSATALSATRLVADSAVAEVDVRLPPGLTAAGILATLEQRFAAAGVPRPQIEVIASFDPEFTPPDAAIVRATSANSAAVRGEPALPVLRLGATDARFFRAAGIPTVVFGPKAYNMGGPNEYVTLDDLRTVARVHAGVVVDFL